MLSQAHSSSSAGDGAAVPSHSSAAVPHARRSKARHKKFIVQLTPAQRAELEQRVRSGSGSQRDVIRTQVILLSDTSTAGPGLTDTRIALETGLSVRTIETLRKRFIENGPAGGIGWRRLSPAVDP